MRNMRVSPVGQAIIKHYESVRLRAYPDPATGAAPWTIGYGHTRNVRPGDTCSQAQADAWLVQDLMSVEIALNDLITWPITQGQFDALASLAFNIGTGPFRPDATDGDFDDFIKSGNLAEIRNRIAQFRMANGKVMYGLQKRRRAEQALWDGLSAAKAIRVGDSVPR